METDAESSLEIFLGLIAVLRDRSDDLAESRRERIDRANPCRRAEASFRRPRMVKRQRR